MDENPHKLIRPLDSTKELDIYVRGRLIDLLATLKNAACTGDLTLLTQYLEDACNRIDLLEPIDVIVYVMGSLPGRDFIGPIWNRFMVVVRDYHTKRNIEPDERLIDILK